MRTAKMNRRNWFKNSAWLTGGLALLPASLPEFATAAPRSAPPFKQFLSDNDIARETTPPDIKARLSANENPFGPSAKAKKAIAEAIDGSYRYAFFEGRKMGEMIISHEGINADQLLMSAGSSALLQAAAVLYKSGTIVSAQPSYEDLLSKSEDLGGKVIRVPLTANYTYDLQAMEAAIDSSTSLVYICNPNNPTGTVLDTNALKSFCERVSKKVPVFVDEAYIDLVDKPNAVTMMPLLKSGHNIMIARTFSKLYGMAGMRFGYVVAPPATIQQFSQVCPAASTIAASTWAAAIASYQDGVFMKTCLEQINTSKNYLYSVLKKEGYEYIPSSTNFVLFPIREDGKTFLTKMMNNGVAVRSWQFNNKHWCRVSIGTMDEMKAFALSLAKIS